MHDVSVSHLVFIFWGNTKDSLKYSSVFLSKKDQRNNSLAVDL